ncbi:hypothetical protein LTR91_026687, partial [Friedmanniomyces endolithicus]
MRLEPIKLLQTHQQPLALVNRQTPILRYPPLHQHQPATIREIQVVRDSGMRLRELAAEFEFREVREEDCGCCGGWEGPLQEVDLCSLAFARDGEDELGVFPGGVCYAAVIFGLHYCAQALGIPDVAEAPDGFDFFVWELGRLVDVDEAAEGFDAIFACF